MRPDTQHLSLPGAGIGISPLLKVSSRPGMVLLTDTDTEAYFRKTCQYISLAGKGGIIFNQKKFQFCEGEVKFLGFRVTRDKVLPGFDFIKSVKDFPRPRDITGIRSWFGLTNQLAFAFTSIQTMQAFRDLLKPSSEFV